MDFRVHNTTWEPVDYDGIKLMRRPSAEAVQDSPVLPDGFSKAAKYRKISAVQKKRREKAWNEYVALDVETTGLRPGRDRILEIGAVQVRGGVLQEVFDVFVLSDQPVPQEIVQLTGITDQMIQEKGIPLKDALERLSAFVGPRPIVCHNLPFDLGFLNTACQSCGLKLFQNSCQDTLVMSRKQIRGVPNYKLGTLAQHLNLETETLHRALGDCRLTARLYEKLNEI